MSFKFPIQTLAPHHQRSGFSCGIESLDIYLQKQAGQESRRKAAVVYVQVDDEGHHIAGYYTLSSTNLDAGELPPEIARKLPKYPRIGATLIGRLAVDKRHQKKGLGERLLLDGLVRSFESSLRVASVAVVVEAENEQAIAFYKTYGFIPFPDKPDKLFLPMGTIEDLYRK